MKLVLLVSSAHALVHLLEQSLASVEQVISNDFDLSMQASGYLGLALRLPYGLGAFFAGLLADRFGEKRILVVYLIGAAIVSASFSATGNATILYGQVFSLGAFASMYHPAGLALLANQTTPAERPRALGLHGVFGSVGIAAAPFLAGMMLSFRPGDWQGYYLVLGVGSALLGIAVWKLLTPVPVHLHQSNPASKQTTEQLAADSPRFQLIPYILLVCGTALGGTVYGGVLHFLPRYLKESGALETTPGVTSGDPVALGNYAAAIALICGAAGQYVAGRLARPHLLPRLLSAVYALNIPFLFWMTFASGFQRLLAACLWAFCHFMNQPIYNSLLPRYLPSHRRSVGFGFSNLMGFGIGAFGPPLVARFDSRFADYTYSYLALAGLALVAALLPLPLAFGKAGEPESDTH